MQYIESGLIAIGFFMLLMWVVGLLPDYESPYDYPKWVRRTITWIQGLRH